MKQYGKMICITEAVMLGVLLFLMYVIHPYFSGNGMWMQLLLLIFLETIIYKTVVLVGIIIIIVWLIVICRMVHSKILKKVRKKYGE